MIRIGFETKEGGVISQVVFYQTKWKLQIAPSIVPAPAAIFSYLSGFSFALNIGY